MVFMHSCRLQAESMSWESLLNKHRRKADELDKWALLHKHTAHMDSRSCSDSFSLKCWLAVRLSRCRCVERGEEKGVPLDPSCFAKSSQSQLILNKPDYKAVLTGQQKLLRNMELVVRPWCFILQALNAYSYSIFRPENAIDISQASSSASIVTSLLTNTFIFAVNVDICYYMLFSLPFYGNYIPEGHFTTKGQK